MPWYDAIPDIEQWFADYSTRRYGVKNAMAAEAWNLIRTSALDMRGNGQGPHEALMCARPNLDGNTASTWGVNNLFYNPDLLIAAAHKLLNSGLGGNNYLFDLTDISRQVLTDYARRLVPLMKQAYKTGDTESFNNLKNIFLQLILDINDLLNSNSDFMLGNWVERVRKIADEVSGTTLADRNWLELNNARQLITTWSNVDNALHDYSYRQWGGLMKDYYYERWKKWFDEGMMFTDWFQWEWEWAHSNPGIYSTTPIGNSKDVATKLLQKYFSSFNSTDATNGTYYVARMIETDATGSFFDKVFRGNIYKPDCIFVGTEINEIAIDFNNDNNYDDRETIINNDAFFIPSNITIGKYSCRISLKDSTVFTFSLNIE